jgi:tetratricopeptide (TPR) repeat protein
MTWLNKLFGASRDDGRVDYYQEGLELLSDGKFHEALTSFRLALKEAPGDPVVLQQIAISYTRIGMTDEAAKTYRHVLKNEPDAAGAHYGLAFLYLRAGQHEDALRHLRAFLANVPDGGDAEEHVQHARTTMAQLTGEMEIPEPEPDRGN